VVAPAQLDGGRRERRRQAEGDAPAILVLDLAQALGGDGVVARDAESEVGLAAGGRWQARASATTASAFQGSAARGASGRLSRSWCRACGWGPCRFSGQMSGISQSPSADQGSIEFLRRGRRRARPANQAFGRAGIRSRCGRNASSKTSGTRCSVSSRLVNPDRTRPARPGGPG
jgi:hypothetical protein